MPDRDGNLTSADRVTLLAVMDHLIPPVDDFPGAGSLGLAQTVEETAAGIPHFRSALITTLDALSLDMSAHAFGGFGALDADEQIEALESVEQSLPGPFGKLVELVYIVYYSDQRAHERIGWKTGPLQPAGFHMEPFDETVLANVRDREPFWRKA